MQKLCLYIFLCMAVPAAWAETIASVSFNPSRMGEYTYLKVADKASLAGGLNAETVNISSGGTVMMSADSSSRIYDVPVVTGASGSAINMPSTVFHGNTSNTYGSYQSSSESTPSGLLPNTSVRGGKMTFNNDSYISTLDAVGILRQKVATLKGGALEITGDGGNNVNLYEAGATAGFYLAGNDIPEPTAGHTYNSATKAGVYLTGCQLGWEKRKTAESPAKEVYLLALKDCTSSASGGTCSDASYKVSHKSECCPTTHPASPDNICWSKTCTPGYDILKYSEYSVGSGTQSGIIANMTADEYCVSGTIKNRCAMYQTNGGTCYSVGDKCVGTCSKSGGYPYATFNYTVLECKKAGSAEEQCTWKKLF